MTLRANTLSMGYSGVRQKLLESVAQRVVRGDESGGHSFVLLEEPGELLEIGALPAGRSSRQRRSVRGNLTSGLDQGGTNLSRRPGALRSTDPGNIACTL